MVEIPGPFFVRLNYQNPDEIENEMNRVYRQVGNFFTKIEEEFRNELNGYHYVNRDFSRICFSLGNNYGVTSSHHSIGQYVHLSRFKEIPLANVLETKTKSHVLFTFSKDLETKQITKILDILSKIEPDTFEDTIKNN